MHRKTTENAVFTRNFEFIDPLRSFDRNMVFNYTNLTIRKGLFIRITIIPTNPPPPPISAYCSQDRALHIRAVHLLPEHLRHIQSRGSFQSIHFICPLFVDFLKAFQSVYQFPYILCYNVLYDFVSLIFIIRLSAKGTNAS